MRERDLIDAILLEYGSRPYTRLWRNETARAWVGPPGDQKPIQAGLCRGSSDIVGIHCGVFVAIEVKVGRQRATDRQRRFLETVLELGGLAGVVRSLDDVRQLIGE